MDYTWYYPGGKQDHTYLDGSTVYVNAGPHTYVFVRGSPEKVVI